MNTAVAKSASPKKAGARKAAVRKSPRAAAVKKSASPKKVAARKSPKAASATKKSASPKKVAARKSPKAVAKKSASPKKSGGVRVKRSPVKALKSPSKAVHLHGDSANKAHVPEELRNLVRKTLNERAEARTAGDASKKPRRYTDAEVREIGEVFVESLYNLILEKGRRALAAGKDKAPRNVTFLKYFSFKLVQQKQQTYRPPPPKNGGKTPDEIQQGARYSIRMGLQSAMKRRLESEFAADAARGLVKSTGSTSSTPSSSSA